MTTIGENRVFTTAEVHAWGNQPQIFAITKATAAAITLVAPGKDQDGLIVTFTSLTAAAHVITATALIADGVTGGPHGTVTFAAFAGASITLMAQNGCSTRLAPSRRLRRWRNIVTSIDVTSLVLLRGSGVGLLRGNSSLPFLKDTDVLIVHG
jgi:hypothetical protein